MIQWSLWVWPSKPPGLFLLQVTSMPSSVHMVEALYQSIALCVERCGVKRCPILTTYIICITSLVVRMHFRIADVLGDRNEVTRNACVSLHSCCQLSQYHNFTKLLVYSYIYIDVRHSQLLLLSMSDTVTECLSNLCP